MSQGIQVLTGETVAMLKDHLALSVNQSRNLIEEVLSYGEEGMKGFDLGMVAVGILAHYRKPELIPETGDHLPFIFDIEDKRGSARGFKRGFTLLANELSIGYLPTVLNNVTKEETVCALHPKTGLWLVAQLVEPSVTDCEKLQLNPDTPFIESFKVIDEQDGFTQDPTLDY